jgi:hypothetical protein
MFERFTASARGVVIRAQEEARELQHNYIGTEHILLGLFAAPTSVAATALRQLGVTASAVRDAVEMTAGRGEGSPTGHIPFTKRAKKLLELSLREALQLKHNYIGTEHILMAIEREGEGLAAKILFGQIRDLRTIRTTVRELLADGEREQPVDEPAHRTTAADEVVTVAKALAGDAPMGSHHLLEALIRAEGSMAAKVLRDLGIDAATIAAKVDEFDTDGTTDATPQEGAARRMELRVVSARTGVVSARTGKKTGAATGEGPDIKAGKEPGTATVVGPDTEAGQASGTETGMRSGEEAGAATSAEPGPRADQESSAEAGDAVRDEVHLVFRDQATIGLAKAVTELAGGPLTGTGPVAGKFVPLWTATNEMLMSLLQTLRDEPPSPDVDRGTAALLVRRVLHDRLRRRGRAAE